jgi:hypothetical protein
VPDWSTAQRLVPLLTCGGKTALAFVAQPLHTVVAVAFRRDIASQKLERMTLKS